MYRKHPDGTDLFLQGITVHVPPVGIVWDFFTNEWVETEVKSRSKSKKEQYWFRDELPKWYDKKRKEEERIILETGDPDYVIEECEEARAKFWFHRLNGQWFMNDGEPTYITGEHWFYLNCWYLDIGLPSYMDSDRKEFYHREYCIQDPLSFGQLIIGPRRFGKTYKGCNFLYEPISRSKNSKAGIQSKTDGDAKKVFAEHLISQFRKLPHFFKPTYDRDGGDIPKSSLRFYKTSKKGKKIDPLEELQSELESTIDYKSSNEYAYDGSKLKRVLHDEIFKTKDVDVYKRWNVVKPCLQNPMTRSIIGKGLCTTTVEEIEGKLETYEKMWNDSNPEKRDKNGHTESGLYHYFIPATHVMNIDKYGKCDLLENEQIILNTIEGMSDQKDRSDYKRKFPLSIKDAFRPQSKDCHYDLEKLENRYDILSLVDDKYITGDFRWNNPNDKKDGVRFVPMKTGKFFLHKDIDYTSDVWNQVSWDGSKPRPGNKAKFVLGIDPFDHKTTVDGRRSDGSGSLFYKYDPLNPLKSDKFVLIYCHRPKRPSIFYDDMLKICWFFGCQMLFEDQKQGIRQHFDAANCDKFMLQILGRKEPGIPAHDKTHQAIVDHTMEYIDDCIDQVDFPQLISDWVKFDINNTTKFDLGMSSGYALLGADRVKPKKQEVKEEVMEVSQLFRTY